MKPISVGLLLLFTVASTALPQGQITFGNNLPTLKAPIYGTELDWINFGGDYANAKTGNTVTGIPPGTQIYGGALLASFPISFWAAPGVVTDGHLLSPGSVTTALGVGPSAGFFPTTTVTFANLPQTGVATVQVRVSDPSFLWAFGGYYTNGAIAAVSSLVTVDIGSVATGLRSFSVGWLDQSTLTPYVPEPAGVSLLVLGLVVIVCMRHSWRKS